MALVSTRADEPSVQPVSPPLPPPSENSASTEQPQTDPWESFDSAWSSLKLELMGWSEDSLRLYGLLEALQTEASGLRSSLTLSREQYEASEEARMIERKEAEAKIVEAIIRGVDAEFARDRALVASRRWRTTALIAAGAAALGWLLVIF
jgi:hypothetical protein